MTMLIGALLGVSGIRFRWHGLAALVVLAILLPFISTALAMNNSVNEDAEYNFSLMGFARVTSIQFLALLFWYGVGAGVHWIFERTRRKQANPE